MALGIVLAGWWSDYSSPRKVLIWGCIGTILVGLIFGPAMGSGSVTAIFLILSLALFAMGFVYGPLGAWLTALFPTQLRYTGTSIAFNAGGILGGALRSEEHTSELQSLMRISYAVFCLKKKKTNK